MLGLPEMVLLVVLASMLLGPERVPGFVRQFVRKVASWRAELRQMSEALKDDVDISRMRDELRQVREELDRLRTLPDELAGSVSASLEGAQPTVAPTVPGRAEAARSAEPAYSEAGADGAAATRPGATEAPAAGASA